jgi:hypothetical protein
MAHENNPEKKDEDSIIIDKKEYKSAAHTSGAALYNLGHIGPGYDLWREVSGPGDDQLIPNDPSPINLKNGEHFYSAQSTLNPGVRRG